MPGFTTWLDVAGSPTEGIFYMHWHPEAELVPGTYALYWGESELPHGEFVVEGSVADAAEIDFDATPRVQDTALGTQFICGNGLYCDALQRTQIRELPIVDVELGELTPSQSTQFLYRLVAVDAPDSREPGRKITSIGQRVFQIRSASSPRLAPFRSRAAPSTLPMWRSGAETTQTSAPRCAIDQTRHVRATTRCVA